MTFLVILELRKISNTFEGSRNDELDRFDVIRIEAIAELSLTRKGQRLDVTKTGSPEPLPHEQ